MTPPWGRVFFRLLALRSSSIAPLLDSWSVSSPCQTQKSIDLRSHLSRYARGQASVTNVVGTMNGCQRNGQFIVTLQVGGLVDARDVSPFRGSCHLHIFPVEIAGLPEGGEGFLFDFVDQAPGKDSSSRAIPLCYGYHGSSKTFFGGVEFINFEQLHGCFYCLNCMDIQYKAFCWGMPS